jgi:hypothetical protein
VLRHTSLAGLVDHGALPGGATFVARAWIEGSDLAAHVRALPHVGAARDEAIGALVCAVA